MFCGQNQNTSIIDLIKSPEFELLSRELRKLGEELNYQKTINDYKSEIINQLSIGNSIPPLPEELKGDGQMQILYRKFKELYDNHYATDNFSLDKFITSVYHSIARASENNKFTYQKIFEQYYEKRLETSLEKGVLVEREIYKPKSLQVELDNGNINVPLVSIFPHEFPRLNEISTEFETSLCSLQSSNIVQNYENKNHLQNLLNTNRFNTLTWAQFITLYKAIKLTNLLSLNRTSEATETIDLSDAGKTYAVPISRIPKTHLENEYFRSTPQAQNYLAETAITDVPVFADTTTDIPTDPNGYCPLIFRVGGVLLVIHFSKNDTMGSENWANQFEIYEGSLSNYLCGPKLFVQHMDSIYEIFKKWANLYLLDLDGNQKNLQETIDTIGNNRDGYSLNMKIDEPDKDKRTVKFNMKFTYSDNNSGLEKINDILTSQIIIK
jgi:hypothetical protein